jgi:hypothetical protein
MLFQIDTQAHINIRLLANENNLKDMLGRGTIKYQFFSKSSEFYLKIIGEKSYQGRLMIIMH